MQRILVILLAAFDALIAVAVGVAAALAPLTLLWVFGIGAPQWNALWPAAGTVWQLGNLVPLAITLPGDYLALAGIDPAAASFTLSLTPLAFAAFTAIFAARSGARAAVAGAWVTGVSAGTVGMAALAAVIAVTSANPVASAQTWQAILFPTLLFGLAALSGALVASWREGDGGIVDVVHERVRSWRGEWDAAPGLIARGSAIALTGLIGLGALAVAVAMAVRGGEVIALFETGHVDALGATIVTLAQLAYLPTLVVWALAWVTGPGFALGVGTAVSPAGTQLGVVPAIPVLGAVPETDSPWLLTLAVLPVIVGGIAGWAVRSRVATIEERTDARAAVPVHPALAGLLPDRAAEPAADLPRPSRPLALLTTVALGISLVTAGAAALLVFLASGSLGPGRLAETGPAAGPVALAVGVETLLGAGIVLLTTRRTPRPDRTSKRRGRGAVTEQVSLDGAAPASDTAPDEAATAGEPAPVGFSGSLLDDLRARVADDRPTQDGPDPEASPGGRTSWRERHRTKDPDDTDTAPIELPDPTALGARRPAPLPPVD